MDKSKAKIIEGISCSTSSGEIASTIEEVKNSFEFTELDSYDEAVIYNLCHHTFMGGCGEFRQELKMTIPSAAYAELLAQALLRTAEKIRKLGWSPHNGLVIIDIEDGEALKHFKCKE